MEPLDLFDCCTSLLSVFKFMYNYTYSTYCTLNCGVTLALHTLFYFVIKLHELLKMVIYFSFWGHALTDLYLCFAPGSDFGTFTPRPTPPLPPFLKYYTVSKNIPDVFSYNSRKHCRIFIICGRNITKKASSQKMLYFPPHLINAAALPREIENTEIVSFHVNVSSWFSNRHTSHIGIIT